MLELARIYCDFNCNT